MVDATQRRVAWSNALAISIILVGLGPMRGPASALHQANVASSSDDVPRAIAERLLTQRLTFFSSNSVEIELGSIPQILQDFIPDEAIAVASAVDLEHALTLLDIPRSRWVETEDDLATLFTEVFARSPFRRTHPENDYGFVAHSGSLPLFFCRGNSDSIWIALENSEANLGTEFFHVALTRGPQRLCDPATRRRIWGNPKSVPVPLLVAPPGVNVSGGGQSSGPDSADISSHLTDAPHPPVELTYHFAQQFVDAGWTLGPVFDQGPFAFVTALRVSTEEDRAWFALLQIHASGEEERSAVLKIHAIAAPPDP